MSIKKDMFLQCSTPETWQAQSKGAFTWRYLIGGWVSNSRWISTAVELLLLFYWISFILRVLFTWIFAPCVCEIQRGLKSQRRWEFSLSLPKDYRKRRTRSSLQIAPQTNVVDKHRSRDNFWRIKYVYQREISMKMRNNFETNDVYWNWGLNIYWLMDIIFTHICLSLPTVNCWGNPAKIRKYEDKCYLFWILAFATYFFVALFMNIWLNLYD